MSATAPPQEAADQGRRLYVRSLLGGLGLAAGIIVLDQVTKYLVLFGLLQDTRLIEVTPFFNLVTAWNTGVSFGIMGAQNLSPWFFFALSVGVSIALGVWMARTRSRVLVVALGLMIGGAIGNAIDRVRWGAVFDFLDVHAMGWHWPAFNVADAAIVVGAALLVLDSLFRRAD